VLLSLRCSMNYFRIFLAVVFAVCVIGCSGSDYPVANAPEDNQLTSAIPDPPYDSFTEYSEIFSFDIESNRIIAGPDSRSALSLRPVVSGVVISEESSEISFSISLMNPLSTVYDARIVFDNPTIPAIHFGIIPSGKQSVKRKISIVVDQNENDSIKAHLEYKLRPYIRQGDSVLHTDGYEIGAITKNASGDEIVSNEVIAGIPDGKGLADVYDYLALSNLMPVGIISALGCLELRILDDRSPVEVVNRIQSDSVLVHPEINPIVKCASFPTDPIYNKILHPSDDLRWAFERVQAVEAWDYYSDKVLNNSGSADVRFGTAFAIIDTGITFHQDFNLSPTNIYVMNTFGKNFIDTGQPPIDDHIHGTMVTGVLSATGNNSFGMAGMAWNPVLIPIKSISKDATTSGFSFELGIAYVRGIASQYPFTRIVTNISVGFHSEDVPYWCEQAVNYVNQAPNVILVCCAGNSANDKTRYGVDYEVSADNYYPAAFESTISVGASARNKIFGQMDKEVILAEEETWGTNWGDTVDLCAPGTKSIYTTSSVSTTHFVTSFGGTSAATCFVAGAAGLLWSLHPEWTRDQIRSRLISTTDDMLVAPWKRFKLGSGRLNAYQAIKD
jgi:subtilisin family serine protease